MMYRIIGRASCVLVLVASVTFGGALFAQDDTALARQVHADINQQLASFNTVSAILKRPDVEYQSNVRAWADASGVRKIETTDHDDDGEVMTEYYYVNGALVFVYQAIKGFNDAGKQATRIEHRQYFRDGAMFKWLSGTDKTPIAANTAEFAGEAKTRLQASALFVQALYQAYARKAPAKPVSGK